VTAPIASVIIPSHNHAAVVGEAITSALAQTIPVEVIIVDDGSTDATPEAVGVFAADPRVRYVRQPHSGPSSARNLGITLARGAFVMFLDADDTIEPAKLDRQIRAFDPTIGWVLCDVEIRDAAKRRTIRASEQYAYDRLDLGGWIAPILKRGNVIPIMSPLIRRETIGAIRFDDAKVPEDWHFWIAIAEAARCRYVPEVLATYRHGITGRSRLPKSARQAHSGIRSPLRLNLGCGNPADRSWHPLPGLVNLDKALGWKFEDGLREFAGGSVAGITISHALMYLAGDDWPAFVEELARVLEPGGVVRITEDETSDPKSSRRGGWKGSQPAITLTTPAFVRAHLEAGGFDVFDVGPDDTRYRDASLCQRFHGDPPHVFFVEGVKRNAVLFAPHADDETLFAAFTLQRARPRIVICFPSVRDYGDTFTRVEESRAAAAILGAGPVEQWTGGDLVAKMRAFVDANGMPAEVWAPSANASHADHVAVAAAAGEVFGSVVRRYQTYRGAARVREGLELPPPAADAIERKLRALACYRSQLRHPRASAFFLDDQREYEEC
jgi:glycosyltransferase involved in cell wall biosynthesis/LmbE family N-acetylglucosaminyl deacetylase